LKSRFNKKEEKKAGVSEKNRLEKLYGKSRLKITQSMFRRNKSNTPADEAYGEPIINRSFSQSIHPLSKIDLA
jgi:hypothetical protein